MTQFQSFKDEHGVTIIEMLMVISVLAIVLALSLPAIRSVRSRSDVASHLAKLRGHTQIMHLYASDYRDTWPTVDPKALNGTTVWEVAGLPKLSSTYFGLAAAWPKLLCAQYFEGDLFHPTFQTSATRRLGPNTPFYLSSSIWAEPAYWRPETRIGPQQWKATLSSHVALPSQKVLMANFVEPPPQFTMERRADRQAVLRPGLPVALVDGAAQLTEPARLEVGYERGDGSWPGTYLGVMWPGMHTIDGVQGRDLR